MPTHDSSFNFSVTSHGSSSTQQAVQKSYTRQQHIETHQSHTFGDSEQYAEHTSLYPPANPSVTSSGLENTTQETGQGFRGQTSTHPSILPDWLQPFDEWLPTRKQWVMSVRGLGDPLLCRSIWIRVFGEWLQLHQLLSSQGIGALTVLPHCWNDVFDLWLQYLLSPDTQGPDPSHTQASAPPSASLSAFPASRPTTPHTPDMGSSHTTSPTRKGCKSIPNAVSKFTLQEIQEACRRNEADESDIARLAVVFPDVVSRDCLMLTRRPSTSAGDKRDHQGYMEFAGRCMVSLEDVKKRGRGTGGTNAGQVQRYYCKLCGAAKRPRWKNSKDLLGHVWDTHCGPQGSGKLSLSFVIRARD